MKSRGFEDANFFLRQGTEQLPKQYTNCLR